MTRLVSAPSTDPTAAVTRPTVPARFSVIVLVSMSIVPMPCSLAQLAARSTWLMITFCSVAA